MELASLLDFQNDILQELDTSACFCLLASGIAWQQPLVARLRSIPIAPCASIILLLGFRPQQKDSLKHAFGDQGDQLREINSSVSVSERGKIYSAGGFSFITTRILVVDLLSGKLNAESISGLVIFNAHRVTDDSGEALVIRLFRRINKIGFIYAFSDQPFQCGSGIRKAEELMRALHIHKLSLWPRFQASVKASLETRPIQVIELAQPMTPAMYAIQEIIKKLIMALLEDLKKTNTFDISELTIENTLFRNFDKLAQRQLDLVWHTTTWKTKQLVEDLKQLRELLNDLVTHDAITFLSFLERIKATGGDSIWLFHNVVHELFQYAKQRVYTITHEEQVSAKRQKAESGSTQIPKKPSLEPVLEQLPKWKALLEILAEVQSEKSFSGAKHCVLIVCKEMFLSIQLQLVLQDPNQLMKQLFEEYLISKKGANNAPVEERKPRRTRNAQKCDLFLYPMGESSHMESVYSGSTEDAALEEARQKTKPERKKKQKRKLTSKSKQSSTEGNEDEECGGRPSLLYDKELLESTQSCELLENVHFYALDSKEESVLWKFLPDCVILYHSDIGFIRQIEVYQAQNPTLQIQVFQIYYEHSIEKERYEISVRRENEIFGELIQHKGRIMVPTDLDTDLELSHTNEEMSGAGGIESQNRLTRKGGIPSSLMPKNKIIVDMREFMSKFPTILHKNKFELHPMTLDIGDYLLAPGLIIERKTVADLHSSLKSGRLYNQVEAMVKNFEFPILLIEFEAIKQFRLQSDEELGNSISQQHISSKLALLILHFPKLKLVWSQSPQATSEIFRMFKRARADPNLKSVIESDHQQVTNYAAVEILKKLPGVTETSIHKIMKSCNCLSSLAKQSLESLTELLGSRKNATILYNFFCAPCPKW